MQEKLAQTQGELQESLDQITKDNQVKKKIQQIIAKNKKNADDLNSTLSCLSCLEFLKEPLTLTCGHSICRTCFETHSDPNSKDSLVFCEECKIETKNKVLKEQKVMVLICDRYGQEKEAILKINDLTATAK